MMDGPSYLDELVFFDVVDKLQPLLDNGWYVDGALGKITPVIGQAIHSDAPWVYVNPDPDRQCKLYQHVFAASHIVPTRCLDCWKVVVKMQTVKQLIAFLEWQKEFSKDTMGTGRFCKCGIERRDYVAYQYGAYFYCDSKEQGLRRHAQVVAGIKELGWDDVQVTLKRYCTEFEVNLGDSGEYQQTADGVELEKQILDCIHFPDGNHLLEAQVAEDDMVTSRYTITGTQTGEYMGVPATGNKLEMTMIEIARFKNGKIIEAWIEFDSKAFDRVLSSKK